MHPFDVQLPPATTPPMHPLPTVAAAAATLSLVMSLLFSAHVTTSFTSHDTLPNCNHTFSCGSITGITYPFTGGSRPSYCGLPGFHLTCDNDSNTTLLSTDSLSYRVNQLDQITQTLNLSRSDLYDTTCTNQFLNTTLNSTAFTVGSDNEILSLFYGCNDSVLTDNPPNLFSCAINGVSSSDAYYLIGPVPNDPVLDMIHCNISVTVPILMTWYHQLEANRSLIGVLRHGFGVNYNNPYKDDCAMCYHSGGQCGFDAELRRPICICGDRICTVTGDKSKRTSLSIGLGLAGAALIGIFLGGWFLLIIQKRKRKHNETQSKDLLATPSSKSQITPPLSKSPPTSSSNFSTSIPSYPSTKCDIEKGSTYFGVQMFSYNELEEATDNFDSSKELGDGGFGIVYYGVLNDGRAVAVKRLYENNLKRAEQFMNEVEILARLRHKNLVTLYGCTSRRSRELLLVYEYIPNGTVADHLHGKQSNSSLLTWPVRLSMAIETADALAYLHASDIIHRDVKTNNILLDNNFHVKVADFGLSKLFPTDVTHVSTAPQGTPGYVDPEYYQCYQLTDKSDVYSFGVVLIELISSLQAVDTNRHRHDINLANMAVNKIQNQQLNELVDPCLGFENDYTMRRMVTSVAELAFRCLQQERDMRPTMEEVLKGLKTVKSEFCAAQKVEVVDISGDDDVGLLKNTPPVLLSSPESMNDKWVTTPHSF